MYSRKRFWKLSYTLLRSPSSVAATLSTKWFATVLAYSWYASETHSLTLIRPLEKAVQSGRIIELANQFAETTDWQYEMASSPLKFLLSTTKTSYRVHAIFLFEMCQSALGHGHPVYGKLSVCICLQDCSFGRCSESVSGLVRSATPTGRCLFRKGRSPESPPTLQTLESFCRLRETYSTRLERY